MVLLSVSFFLCVLCASVIQLFSISAYTAAYDL